MQKNKELEIDKEKLAAEARCCLEQHIVELSGQLHQAISRILAEKSCNILQMTVMRADLYQGAPMLAVRGYDERWYLDEDPKTIYLPVPYLWTSFAQVYEQMQRKLSVYMGAVSEYDIRNQLCEYFLEVFVNLAGLMRGHFYHLKDINPPFQILWGIYKGDNRILLYQDRYGKDTTQFLSELQPVNQFRSFDEAELLKEQVKEKTFVYLNARRSRIQEMQFEACTFVECQWDHSTIKWSTFTGSLLRGCMFAEIHGYQMDLSDATVEYTGFDGSSLHRITFDGAALKGVSFEKSTLKYISFRDAKLEDVDLRAEALEAVDFTGAELKNVYVYERDLEKFTLTETQKQQVYILEEKDNEIL